MFQPRLFFTQLAVGVVAVGMAASAMAQSVGLPAPRLLTTLPMGGQLGTTFEITISGENIDGETELLFSHSGITAKPKGDGKADENKYIVTIAKNTPVGIHEARVMTRLGVSSCRAFTVGTRPEVTRAKPNTSLAQALELKLNSICNATMSPRAVDFYSFNAKKGQRIVAECASKGIDSRLNSVLIIADATGRDLVVDRLGGLLDFKAPADGKYIIKVHELTYKGGAHYFYRLALSELPEGAPIERHPTTMTVSSFSWRPEFKLDLADTVEKEPNNQQAQAQKIALPCQITGRFFPAADVDTFEFNAKKGEEWWVEVVSERLGLPTDPFVLIQRVGAKDGKLTDILELNDIAPPIKPSSNGYSYDGPPYNAGSADVLGKFTAKTDGLYRLQVRDLFGGTRSIPEHRYRLILRKAQPDFTLVAWALHMNLRNGDRNALSKPIALRNGRTMAFEVVTVRRDGFDGEIELGIEGLPKGMSSCGFSIPKGKTRGILTITAAENAPRSMAGAQLFGRSKVEGKTVKRQCHLASMQWPVKDARGDIPAPRLFADVPVSVGGAEGAPITIRPKEAKILEAKADQKLTIPLQLIRRGEFSGATINLKAFGPGFEKCSISAPLKEDKYDAVLDLAALKIPPGEHAVAFYGSVVSKYRYNDAAIILADAAQKKAAAEAKASVVLAKKLADAAKAAPAEKKSDAEKAAKMATEKQQAAEKASAQATSRFKSLSSSGRPADIVDIVVSEPVRIRVLPAEKK